MSASNPCTGSIPAGANGNVQAAIDSANVNVASDPSEDSINVGTQTVPLQKVQDFFSAESDLEIAKSDLSDPVTAGELLTYVISVMNNGPAVANDVTVVDTLPYESSAWLVGDVETFKPPSDALVVKDSQDRPVVLFRSTWSKNFARERNPQHDFKDMG